MDTEDIDNARDNNTPPAREAVLRDPVETCGPQCLCLCHCHECGKVRLYSTRTEPDRSTTVMFHCFNVACSSSDQTCDTWMLMNTPQLESFLAVHLPRTRMKSRLALIFE